MSMSSYKWWFILLIPACLTGCVSFSLPKAAAPVYYQLDYQHTPVPCSRAFQKGVRVWKFTSSSPYGRTEMAVLNPEGKVQFSHSFQWVASPGTLVSQSLLRDLTLSPLFPQAVSANDPANVPLELSGHVFVFAWERTGSISRAALQVEVSLIDTEPPRRVIFRRSYDLKSGPMVENTSAAFAQAMSGLMQEFSQKFQQDLGAALITSPAPCPSR
jgi:ABC-type uncharacterized transport system auxiliary subunit